MSYYLIYGHIYQEGIYLTDGVYIVPYRHFVVPLPWLHLAFRQGIAVVSTALGLVG